MMARRYFVRAGRYKGMTILKKQIRSFSARQEIVEGVFLFHRHGDRTPGKSLVADNYTDEESSFWKTRIPPTDQSYYEMLSQRFPAKLHPDNNSGQFKDASGGNESYGFLTWKGMHQMYHTGNAMSGRYGPKGGERFQDYWNITAFSTNYLRTVKSCQTFLDGLLSSSSSSSITVDYEQPTHYENVDPENYLKYCDTPGIEITVRDIKNETLNAFDSSPELMKKLFKDVIATPEFIDKDTKAAFLAARLSNYVPGLMKQSSYGGSSPSGINWIDAADHFVCRSSHSISLTKFSHLQNDPSAEETLQSMSHATIWHLASRFRSWYQSPSILGEMAGPVLNEIKVEMSRIINSKDEIRRPFNVYSCHDVTILGLLYAIKAGFLVSSKELQSAGVNMELIEENRLSQWPNYATCLTFELVRVKEEGKEDDFHVKVWLNEAPVPTFDIVPIPTMAALQQNKEAMTLSDFDELIREINGARVS